VHRAGAGGETIPSKQGITMNRITLAVALSLATLSTAAVAQTAQEQQACMNDAFRVCSATIPDRNRTVACMIQHKAELSAACQVVMAKYSPAEPAPVQMASVKPTQAPMIRRKRLDEADEDCGQHAAPGQSRSTF